MTMQILWSLVAILTCVNLSQPVSILLKLWINTILLIFGFICMIFYFVLEAFVSMILTTESSVVKCLCMETSINHALLFATIQRNHHRALPTAHPGACTCVNRRAKFSPLVNAFRLWIGKIEQRCFNDDKSSLCPEQWITLRLITRFM